MGQDYLTYPHPCDKCTKKSCLQIECEPWLKRFRTIWKQFNTYMVRVSRRKGQLPQQKFLYEHPDIIRRYLEEGPCGKCQRGEDCESPCPAYWVWWDCRREWLRRLWENDL